jgi:cytochrome bd-type quinol oxidase subunit 2
LTVGRRLRSVSTTTPRGWRRAAFGSFALVLLIALWIFCYYDGRKCSAGITGWKMIAVYLVASPLLAIAVVFAAIPAKRHPGWLFLGVLLALFVGFVAPFVAAYGGNNAGVGEDCF